MTLTTRSGREVEVTEIDGELGKGAYVLAASYLDGDGEEVDESICEQLTDDHQEVLYEELYQALICSAEAAYDGDR